MNIVVCIKQVPGTNKVEIDEETGVLKRMGVVSKMNPYDLYSIETALKLKEKHGGKITVITMGPPQAKSIIIESYMMGADKGIILSDKRFAGSDVLSTSYTIASGIKLIKDYDLIICGKQTTDGDTAQVGPAIAEHMNIPHVAWVSKIVKSDRDGMIVEQNMADSYETVQLKFPCLITVEKGIYTPRLPSYLNLKKSENRKIKMISMNDFEGKDEKNYGLSGSPTQVERIFQPKNDVDQVFFNEKHDDCVAEIHNLLNIKKFI